MKNFEAKYLELISAINGNQENLLEYWHYGSMWTFHAVNRMSSIGIGEAGGLIACEARTLEELLEKMEVAIGEFNRKTSSVTQTKG